MKARWIAMGLIGVVLLSGSKPAGPVETEISATGAGSNSLTFDLLRQQARKGVSNVALSGHGLFHCLAMGYVASGGATRAELARSCRYPDDNATLVEGLAALNRGLGRSASGKVEARFAASLWVDRTFADFRKDYLQTVTALNERPPEAISFQQADEASDTVNRWVRKATDGRIDQIVSPGDFASASGGGWINEPALVAVSALSFQAKWESRFDESQSRADTFHPRPGEKMQVRYMHQENLLAYAEDKEFRFLQLPYAGRDFSMLLYLPKENLTPERMTALLDEKRCYDLRARAFGHSVDVLLPRFEFRHRFDARSALEALGVRRTFDSRSADFDGMINKRTGAFRIYFRHLVQETWIKVDEEGTKAASTSAGTGFSIGCSAAHIPVPAEFHADHPFLFLIIHNPSRAIVLGGWVAQPSAP